LPDPANQIVIAGGDWTDWAVFFCAIGTDEAENGQAELAVEAPRDAGVVIHASYAATQVRDVAGAVRIAATHARASILNTTGLLDVTAGTVDFAGCAGRVTISAEMDANLKMTSPE
jgi:hypothetical protein